MERNPVSDMLAFLSHDFHRTQRASVEFEFVFITT